MRVRVRVTPTTCAVALLTLNSHEFAGVVRIKIVFQNISHPAGKYEYFLEISNPAKGNLDL